MRPWSKQRRDGSTEAGFGYRLIGGTQWGEVRTGKKKGCLQENKQEREKQRVSSCSAGSRWSCAVHGCLEGVLQGKIELRGVIREAARPGAHIPWNGQC